MNAKDPDFTGRPRFQRKICTTHRCLPLLVAFTARITGNKITRPQRDRVVCPLHYHELVENETSRLRSSEVSRVTLHVGPSGFGVRNRRSP